MVMSLDQYQELAARTLPRDGMARHPVGRALALASEVGELGGALDKVYLQGHPETDAFRANIREEIGDTLWQLAAFATTWGVSLGDVAGENIAKLQKRYPGNGHSTQDSMARVDVNG